MEPRSDGRHQSAGAAPLVRHAEPLVSRGCKVSRPNEKGHRANGAPEIRVQNQHQDFASDSASGKALRTMQARAALAGCALYELGEGGFVVGGRGDSKAAPDLRAVGNLLRQIGGRS